jgi:transcription initiation factor TFIIE subunit alpha
MSSGQPTPTATVIGSSATNSPIFSVFNSQLNGGDDEDDEEDRKPNVEYLDSLNAYRKRSRSTEDVGQPSKVKVTKLDSALGGVNGHGYLNGYGHRNGSNGSLDGTEPPLSQDSLMGSQLEEPAGYAEPLDDPICYGWFFFSPSLF